MSVSVWITGSTVHKKNLLIYYCHCCGIECNVVEGKNYKTKSIRNMTQTDKYIEI